MNLFSLKSN